MADLADVRNAYIKGGAAAVLDFDAHEDFEDDPLLRLVMQNLCDAWSEFLEFLEHMTDVDRHHAS